MDTHSFSKQEIYDQILEFYKKLQNKVGNERIPVSLLGVSDIPFLIAFFGTLLSGQIPFLGGRESDIPHFFHLSLYCPNNQSFAVEFNFQRESGNDNSCLLSESDFFIQSSGTISDPKWIGINFENLMHSLALHRDKIDINRCSTISVLPYHHIFGLILDLFLSLEFGNDILRIRGGGWDYRKLCDTIAQEEKIYFCGVPKIFETIIEIGNQELLRKCKSGIVGGARISSILADVLRGSNFHAGYGQTEASPGILLGDRGEFYESYLGKEMGVSVQITEEGTLAFQGKNAFREEFRKNQIQKLEPNRWVDTGDFIEKRGPHYFYRGRKGYSFKLSNGRWLVSEEIELEMHTRTKGLPPFFLAEHSTRGISIFCQSRDKFELELLKKSLPSYLLSEKIWIQTPVEWSKDRKGNPDRKAMQTMISRKPGTLL